MLRMRVVLTDSPDLAKRLNAGSEVLEPRSLAEREAVSPRGSPLTSVFNGLCKPLRWKD